MKSSRVVTLLAVLAVAVLALFGILRANRPVAIPLTIDAVPEKVTGYPVQLGVPFAPGELDRANLRVLRNGKLIPSEAAEMVRWSGKTTGVKCALVRFQADLDTKPTRDYSVVFGANMPEAKMTFPRLDVTEAPGRVTVDTGEVRFEVSENPLVLFRDVRTGDKPLIRESVLEVVRADGKRFSGLTNGKVEVEHTGPMSVTLKLTGDFEGPDAAGLGVLARITAYAGKPYVRLAYTLIQRAPGEVLELKGWKLGLVPAKRFTAYEIGGEEGNYSGEVGGRPVRLDQNGEMTPKDGSLRLVATRLAYTGVGEGRRAPGWAKASSDAGTLLVAVRHFWQQYPKSIEISPDAFDVWLQSPRSEHTFKPLVAGWAKTHEVLLDFAATHEGESDAVRAAFQRGVRASAPPGRYQSVGIFGQYSLPGPASRDHDWVATTFLDYTRFPHVVKFAFQGTGNWWMEGNLNFGNRMVWNYYLNNTRDSAGRLFMHSLRLLEAYPDHSRYAFDLGEAQARCSMDLHVMHCDNREGPYAGWGPGMVFAHSAYHRAPRVLAKYPQHRRYSYYSEPLDVDRTGSRWGPMIHPAGLMEYYLLTGEPRAKEVLTQIADWAVALQKKGGRRYASYIQALDGPTGLYLWTLMSAYEVTGRTDYLDALYAAVDELRKTVEREGGNLAGRRPNATRSGTLLSCLIRLLEFDRRFGRLDRREVTGWIVRTVEAFHKLVRPRDEGPARLSTRCAGNNRMMYHAFGYVASLGDAPDWAKKDFGALLGSPAYHTTHPDEERFEFIRPGCHNDIITVCSTIEEGTEMWLWSSAETMALHEKVFGEAGFPKPDDPMRAYYAEYQRACREDPESIVALAPEAPAPAEHGEFSPIPACVVGWAEAPPTIDGSADDACWKDATALTEFTLPWSKADAERDFSRKSRLDTTIKLACDRENLYVIMIAPDLKPPERRRRRDSGQYRDDGIEIFLDTNFNRTSYWKIAVNLEGEPSDAYYVEPFLAASGWNPKMMIGRRPGVIEIALPFKEFTSKWSVDDLVRPRGKWSANFYRMGDGSSWAGHNMSISSHTPQGFGVLTFEEPEGR